MIYFPSDITFAGWRVQARDLVLRGVPPQDVFWANDVQNSLFECEASQPNISDTVSVPAAFFKVAEPVACFADSERWSLLYRVLYRLIYENRNLLSIESDPEVRRLQLMAKAVRRDIHKFHAFVRFRRVECDEKEIFVAWHEPHHYTVEMATPFFARRFGSMNFSILTPRGCAHWDKKELRFSPPADRSLAPVADEMEDFWLLYYRSIFNPFRLKVNTMKRELPVRHWPTLPEAALIPELIRQAGETSR